MTQPIRAFECTVKGTDWRQIVNAKTRGEAKNIYLMHVRDAWPDVPYTAIRSRSLGPPITSEAFKCNARYRGLPNLRCGARVKVGDDLGTVVDHDSSCNFIVWFDDDAPNYPALRLSVHPHSMEVLP